jgi:ribosomal-protein-alanine N-acetyltransferase
MSADPIVMEFLGGPISRAETEAMLGRCRARRASGMGPWAVEVPGVAPFVGLVGLSRPTYQASFTPCVEILWRIAREHWGRGYATEAARATLREGFEMHGLDEILSFAATTNIRSQRVMEKIGMTRSPEDDFDHPLVPESEAHRRHVLFRARRSV